MAIMSYYLKLHAPGAKTFFQVCSYLFSLHSFAKVIKARYGTTTHMIVLVFGLFTNIIVTLSLLLGGTAVLTALVQVCLFLCLSVYVVASFCPDLSVSCLCNSPGPLPRVCLDASGCLDRWLHLSWRSRGEHTVVHTFLYFLPGHILCQLFQLPGHLQLDRRLHDRDFLQSLQ